MCGKECFNCFQQGRCDYSVCYENSDGSASTDKPLHFCSQPCMDVYIHGDVIPQYLAENQKWLDTVCSILKETKTKPQLLVMKKSLGVEKMLRTSLAQRKPKAELHRLFAMWQECATEALEKIGDTTKESMMLRWAELMKANDKIFPALIDCLGQ